MTRHHVSVIALVALLVLTGATWWLAEGTARPGAIAAVAVLKASVIGGVFLELDRAHPAWAALAVLVVGGIAGGTALLFQS